MTFCKEMRSATRDVHAVSDALVNAKLFFSLSNNNVWAEGLLVFYEIFKFLEEAARRHPNEFISRLFVDGLHRKHAFEQDLTFYLSPDWTKNYTVRDEVAGYVLHLQRLEDSDPDLLIPYVYHLYLGLLSGGQILGKKRQIQNKILKRRTTDGYAVTNFGKITISDLKRRLKEAMEEVAQELSQDKRAILIEESRRVFMMNNKIIKTINGTGKIVLGYSLFIISLFLVLYLLYVYTM